MWDNGGSGGGNYWSSFQGRDTDGDDISNIPYAVWPGNNVDRYPLMRPRPVFMDGCESGSFNAWTGKYPSTQQSSWVTGQFSEVVSITTRVHHGAYSGKFYDQHGDYGSRAYSYRTIAPAPEVYARAYIFVASTGLENRSDRDAFIIMRAGSTNVAYAGWRMERWGGVSEISWYVIVRDSDIGYLVETSRNILPAPVLGKWYCLELRYRKGTTDSLVDVYVDDLLACSMRNRNTSVFGDVDTVRFGLAEHMSYGTPRVYVDCCAISYLRVGPEPT
jgi:hypothetical protein